MHVDASSCRAWLVETRSCQAFAIIEESGAQNSEDHTRCLSKLAPIWTAVWRKFQLKPKLLIAIWCFATLVVRHKSAVDTYLEEKQRKAAKQEAKAEANSNVLVLILTTQKLITRLTHAHTHTHTHLILNRKFVKGQWFWQLETDPFLSGKDGGEVGSKAGRSTGGKNGSTGRVEGGVMQMGWWAKFQLIVQSPLWVSRHDMLWAKMYSFICNVVSKDVHWFKHLIASKLSCYITCYIHNIGLIEMLVFIFEHYSRYIYPLNRQMGKKPSWRSQWSCLPWFMGLMGVGLG